MFELLYIQPKNATYFDFPHFSGLLSAKLHKYEMNGELSVMIAPFAEKHILCWFQKFKFQKSENIKRLII